MRIVLAEDAALLREGLVSLLEGAGHEVIAQAEDADVLRERVLALAEAGRVPDVVVTDVRMPPGRSDDGLRAAVDLRRALPGLPVVVLSAYVAGPYLRDLLEDGGSGGVGYLLKERVGRVADFLRSLEVVRAGGVVVDPEVLASLMRTASPGDDAARDAVSARDGVLTQVPAPGQPGQQGRAGDVVGHEEHGHGMLERLTPRESQVLALMAQGLSNPQIAAELVLSDGAVAKHVANIFLKLDLPPGEENRRVRAVLTWLRAAT